MPGQLPQRPLLRSNARDEARLRLSAEVGARLRAKRAESFAAPTTPREEPRSDWDQGWGSIINPLPGLLKFGGDIGNTGIGLLQTLPTTAAAIGLHVTDDSGDAYLNSIKNNAVLGHLVNTDAIRAAATAPDGANSFMAAMGELAPAPAELATGVAQTGINLGTEAARGVDQIQTGGERDIQSEYAKAFREHNLAPVVMGDLANLGLAGKGFGGVLEEGAQTARLSSTLAEARAAGTVVAPEVATAAAERGMLSSAIGDTLAPYAGRLESMSSRLGTGTELANKIAGAPIEMPLKGAGLAVKGLGKLGGVVAPEATEALATWAANKKSRILDDARLQAAGRGKLFSETNAPAYLERRQLNAELGDVAGFKLSPAEEQAAFGVAVAKDLSPQVVDAVRAYEKAGYNPEPFLAEHGLTPEAIDVAERYHQTKAALDAGAPVLPEDAALVSRIDGAVIASEPGRLRSQERFEEGFGIARPGADPAQTAANRAKLAGDETLFDFIHRDLQDPEAAVAEGRMDLDRATRVKAAVKAGDVDAFNDVYAEMKLDPQYAPPAWRPAVEFARSIREQMLAQADTIEQTSPSTASMLRQAANDVPDTIDAMKAAGITDPAHVFGGEWRPTGRGARGAGRGKSKAEFEKRGVLFDRSFKAQAAQALGDYQKQLFNEFLNSDFVAGNSKHATELGLTGSPGEQVAMAHDLGYKPMRPDGRELAREDWTAKNLYNASWVPSPIVDAIADLAPWKASGSVAGELLAGYDRTLKAYKDVRFLTPKMLMQQVVSNALLLAVATDVPVSQMARQAKGVRELMRNPDLEAAQVFRRSPFKAEGVDFLSPTHDLAEFADNPSRFRRLVNGNYKMLTAVDDFTRGLIFLSKKDEGVLARASADADLAAGRITPEVHASRTGAATTSEQAIEYALKVGGDIANMSRAERAVLTRVLPFYAWHKHITKLALSLPFNNPYRLAWTTYLGNLAYPDRDKLPDRYQDAAPLGDDRFLSMTGIDVLGEGSEGSPLLNPANTLSALTPAAHLAAGAMNINLRTGELQPHPPGMGPMTNGKPSIGFVGLPQLGYYALGILPQTKVARDLNFQRQYGNSMAYPMGEGPMLTHGASGRPVPLPQQPIAGVPTPVVDQFFGVQVLEPDLATMARINAKRGRLNSKAARRYEGTVGRLSSTPRPPVSLPSTRPTLNRLGR